MVMQDLNVAGPKIHVKIELICHFSECLEREKLLLGHWWNTRNVLCLNSMFASTPPRKIPFMEAIDRQFVPRVFTRRSFAVAGNIKLVNKFFGEFRKCFKHFVIYGYATRNSASATRFCRVHTQKCNVIALIRVEVKPRIRLVAAYIWSMIVAAKVFHMTQYVAFVILRNGNAHTCSDCPVGGSGLRRAKFCNRHTPQ